METSGSSTVTSPATSPPAPSRSPTPECGDDPCYGEPKVVGELDSSVVSSVSGMAASVRTPGLYYVVGDEEGTSTVAVVEQDGSHVASIEIDGMAARNAEALAVGPCEAGDDSSCLYIGDIGNHVSLPDLFVYRVREPDLAEPPDSVAAETLQYTYPEEPTDAEALLVDDEGRPLIVSKASFDEDTGDTGPTNLFRGPATGGELEHIAEIDVPEPKNGVFADLVGNVVTGADSAAGSVLLRTYDEVLEFRTDAADADLSSFPDWPVRRVPSPEQVQAESVAYRGGDCSYLSAGEAFGDIALVSC